MRRSFKITIAILATIYFGICVTMFTFQRAVLYRPKPRMVTAPEFTMALPVEGARLVVTTRPHPGPKAIVYFGGKGEDVSVNLQSFSQAFPDHAIYLMHYRGYGGSTGSPSEDAIHRDAAALFRQVQAQHPEVVLIGRSLGTGVAIRLASELPAARLVLVTPYDSIAEIAAHQYPYLPVRWLLFDRYESNKYAPRIGIPTTIVAATRDEVIPRASTDALLARFRPHVVSMTVIEGGHNSLDAGAYIRTLQTALR